MAFSERIIAWLETKNTARFVTDMKLAGQAIHDVGDQADQTSRKLRKLSRDTTISRVQMARLKDHLSLTRGELMTTAITLGAYLSPAILAVGTSAGAALAGGVGVAGGGVAALTTGLAGLGLIAIGASQDLHKIGTALTNYNLTVKQYGKASLQAANASAKLWAVTQVYGGQKMLQIVKNWNNLKAQWNDMVKPARMNFLTGIGQLMESAGKIMPTFASITNSASKAALSAQGGALSRLTSSEMAGHFTAFGNTFNKIIGPISRGFANLIVVMSRVFEAFLPYVEQTAHWFERLSVSWLKGTANSTKLSKVVSILVGHFRSWAKLMGALGRVVIGLFQGSNREGKRLVDTLTKVMSGWADWLGQKDNQDRMNESINNFANVSMHVLEIVKPLSQIYIRLATALLPAVTSAAGALKIIFTGLAGAIQFLTPVIRALGPLISPLIVATVLWTTALRSAIIVIALLEGALGIAEGIKYLTTVIKLATAQQWLWNFATRALPWIAIVTAITAAAVYIATHWSQTIDFIKSTWQGLVDSIKNGVQTIVNQLNRLKSPKHWLDFLGNVHFPGSADLKGILPGHASGGLIPYGYSAQVGERGPETAMATPYGTMISPIATSPTSSERMSPNAIIRLTSVVQVSRRELARANAEYEVGMKSRRGER